jgi:hypothetical protein
MHNPSALLLPGPSGARPARFKLFLAAAALAALALLTVACGGGSPGAAGSSATGQVHVQQALAFAHCMRSHGAPGFPDPGSSGGIVVRKSLMESSFNAPRSARAACVHLLPKYGLTLTSAQQAQHQRQELAFAACMRRHGLPNFPVGWSGNVGQLISAGIDPSSPQLNAALTKCGS